MVLAIVQARMKSVRLPGKVMKKVMGRPMIGYLFERLSHSALIDKIILATSEDPSNDELCQYIESEGYDVFRGSETDVLERYYLASKAYNSDHIVRITGDCPCVDPFVCDQLIKMHIEKKTDYAELSQDFMEGADCEIFTFKALESAHKNATLKSEREHVSLYFNNNADIYSKQLLENETDDSRYRITIDGKEDFSVVNSIFEDLHKDDSIVFTLKDIKDYLDVNPLIHNLNKHIVRNEGLMTSLKNDHEVKVKVD